MPDEPQPAGVSRSTDGRHQARLAREAYAKLPDSEKLIISLLQRLADVEKWQATAQGQQGISVTGNVFTGPKLPLPYTPPLPAIPVNPYELGTTAKGSTDPAGPSAPPALSSPMTDTGLEGLQPLDITNAKTDGYKCQFLTRRRIFNSGSGTFEDQLFSRDIIWDDMGRLYEITEEKLVATSTTTGSGSGSGTV